VISTRGMWWRLMRVMMRKRRRTNEESAHSVNFRSRNK
jgi:hypothetical protein